MNPDDITSIMKSGQLQFVAGDKTQATYNFMEQCAQGYHHVVYEYENNRPKIDPNLPLVISSCPFESEQALKYLDRQYFHNVTQDRKVTMHFLDQIELNAGVPIVLLGNIAQSRAETLAEKNPKNPLLILGREAGPGLLVPKLDFSNGKMAISFDKYNGKMFKKEDDPNKTPKLLHIDNTKKPHLATFNTLELSTPNMGPRMEAQRSAHHAAPGGLDLAPSVGPMDDTLFNGRPFVPETRNPRPELSHFRPPQKPSTLPHTSPVPVHPLIQLGGEPVGLRYLGTEASVAAVASELDDPSNPRWDPFMTIPSPPPRARNASFDADEEDLEFSPEQDAAAALNRGRKWPSL